jgi:crossover junction endodeoxyribonuclease RusA
VTVIEPALRTVVVDVRGRPVPQGSLRLHQMANGKTAARYAPGVYAWRGQLQAAIEKRGEPRFDGPVELRLGFDLVRPNGHYGTGRNRDVIKPSAPMWPTVAPDLDKLTRCVADACTDAGLWRDDAQVVSIVAAKRYTSGVPGVRIEVREMRP